MRARIRQELLSVLQPSSMALNASGLLVPYRHRGVPRCGHTEQPQGRAPNLSGTDRRHRLSLLTVQRSRTLCLPAVPHHAGWRSISRSCWRKTTRIARACGECSGTAPTSVIRDASLTEITLEPKQLRHGRPPHDIRHGCRDTPLQVGYRVEMSRSFWSIIRSSMWLPPPTAPYSACRHVALGGNVCTGRRAPARHSP